jgi:hypothetical protein
MPNKAASEDAGSSNLDPLGLGSSNLHFSLIIVSKSYCRILFNHGIMSVALSLFDEYDTPS